MAWYKSQYEQLEAELSEFQASSKELEAELERDLDAADKRERALQERAETLNFEVEEWKVRGLSLVRNSSMLLAAPQCRWLTRDGAEEIQRVQGGSECCPERTRKGDHDSTRHEQNPSAEASRYRSGQRRF